MVVRESIDSIREIVRRYVDVLRAHHIEPEGVFLFGSHVKGTQREYSDIDVAVVSASLSGDRFDDRCALMYLRWDVDVRIEPHPFRPEDFVPENPEAAEVLRTGIRIL